MGDYNDLKIFDKNSKLLFTKLEGIIGAHDIYADADYIYAAAVNKLYIINRGTIPTPSPTPYGYKTPTPTPSVTPTPDLPVTR